MNLFASRVLILGLLSLASCAENPGFFEVEDPVLSEAFLEEAMSIAGVSPAEREGLTKGLSEEFDRLFERDVMRRACRADPEATLDLINRIQRAGGRTETCVPGQQ